MKRIITTTKNTGRRIDALTVAKALGAKIDCAACGKPSQGNASIHRDGFDEGPQVQLCDACGCGRLPTCETLWKRIAKRRAMAQVASLNERRGAGGSGAR